VALVGGQERSRSLGIAVAAAALRLRESVAYTQALA
jgi:hypothetical protein